MNFKKQLKNDVEKQAKRMKKAEQERSTILSQTVYIGTLGLLFVVPVIAGAYLGAWLDSLIQGYSFRWTLSMLFLGVVVGAMNVYLFIKE